MTGCGRVRGYEVLISTHTSLAGRDYGLRVRIQDLYISTHTSLAGRDTADILFPHYAKFLLTRPSRDVTVIACYFPCNPHISTHTSLAGRDCNVLLSRNHSQDFYSHVPRGT